MFVCRYPGKPKSTGSPGSGVISDFSLLTVMLGVEIRSSAKTIGIVTAEPFLQPPTLYVCIYTWAWVMACI